MCLRSLEMAIKSVGVSAVKRAPPQSDEYLFPKRVVLDSQIGAYVPIVRPNPTDMGSPIANPVRCTWDYVALGFRIVHIFLRVMGHKINRPLPADYVTEFTSPTACPSPHRPSRSKCSSLLPW